MGVDFFFVHEYGLSPRFWEGTRKAEAVSGEKKER
jgi:nitrogen regulatory protein PII-like uncharacterized protein